MAEKLSSNLSFHSPFLVGDSQKMAYYNAFQFLVREKESKLALMREIARFMDPSDNVLLSRSAYSSNSDNALFDTMAMNSIDKFSKDSLADIINPYEAWFNLSFTRNIDTDKNMLQDWAGKATQDLHTYINDSKYYICLQEDKLNYDLYGFSAMSITHENDNLKTYVEDPFSIYYEDDLGDVKVIYWTVLRNRQEMVRAYGESVIDDSDRQIPNLKFEILNVISPNHREYVRTDFREGAGKYVLRRFILRRCQMPEEQVEDRSNLSKEGVAQTVVGAEMIEVGERQYFNEMPIVFSRDSLRGKAKYGDGQGKKILTSIQNSNTIKRDLIHIARFHGDPAVQSPSDLFMQFHSLTPGTVVPYSHTGEKFEFIAHPGDIKSLTEAVNQEHSQILDTVPQLDSPPKKQRQSQFEVQQAQIQAAKNIFLYKVFYLTQGVSKHLARIFSLGLDAGRIRPLPQGVTIEDVKPSLESLLLKEYKRQKGRSMVETLRMLEILAAYHKPVTDNFNFDDIARSIADSSGAGDIMLNDTAIVEQIRRRKLEIMQRREQAQMGTLDSKAIQQQAKGEESRAKVDKLRAETQAIQQQGEQ